MLVYDVLRDMLYAMLYDMLYDMLYVILYKTGQFQVYRSRVHFKFSKIDLPHMHLKHLIRKIHVFKLRQNILQCHQCRRLVKTCA